MTAVGFILLVVSTVLATKLQSIPVPFRTLAWKASDYCGYAGCFLFGAGITIKLWEGMP